MAVRLKSGARGAAALWLVTALVCAAGVWLFAQRVLIPYQMGDAAAHGRPRGNLSDLYPRWIGARELLLHGKDPYSAEITREAQEGYYGRPLDHLRAGDPKDQQGFAYPVYVAFWLFPILNLPFPVVEKGFLFTLIILTSASALLWLRMLRMRMSLVGQTVVVVLTLGSLAVMQGLKLQQMSLLVAGLIAIAFWLLINNYQAAAGIALALASVKPQLVVLPLLWLGIWTLGDPRRRYRWALSFLVVMALQISGGGMVSATLDSALLAGGSRIPGIYGSDLGNAGINRARAGKGVGTFRICSSPETMLEATRPAGMFRRLCGHGRRRSGTHGSAHSNRLGLQSGAFNSGGVDADPRWARRLESKQGEPRALWGGRRVGWVAVGQ